MLDTHTLIWFSENDQHLSKSAKSLIEDEHNKICVGVGSLFEMSIKQKVGKLSVRKGISDFWLQVEEYGFRILSITPQHLASYQTLPLFEQHRDPFDRLLIATAKTEGMSIITVDKKFLLYKNLVDVVW